MPPSDSAPSRQDPAQELSQLRRNMVQQLAASGKLTRAVFDIDRDYFGARFQTKAQESPAGPFRDLEVATTVVETLGEELQGAAAFADSPVLRDHIANLIAGIEELRAMLIQMEASSLGSVGLPSDKVSLKARVYPETNPLACLAEATGFVRESHAWVLRTVERIKGLGLMLEEAERARADAESSVHQISSDEITATLSAEIEARDKELRDLRQRATDLQDQVSGLSRAGSLSEGGLREEIDRLRGELDAAADQVTSDQAEVRSLVVEIERLAADCEQEARPDARDEVDDLVICVQVLHDAIQDRGTPIATLTTAADAVLREWFAWMHRREELNLEELAQTRAFVAKHEKAQVLADQAQQANAAQATANAAAQRLTGELEQFKAKHATAETERAALAKQVQTLTSQQAEAAQKATAQAATAQAEQQRLAEAAKAALARSVALDGELAQAKAQIERLTKAEIDARQAADKAGASAGSTAAAAQAQQAQLDKLRAELATATTALTTAQQQKQAGEQQLATANHKASAAQTEADRLRAQAAQAKVELDAAQKLVAQSQTELATTKKSIETTQAEARSAQEQAQRKTTEATSEVTRLTTQVGELQQAAKQARTEIERLGKELARSAGLGADQDRLRKELDQQKQQRERLEQELLQARQQRDKAVTDLGAARDHAAAAAGRIDAVAEEHINLIEQRDGLQQQLEAMRSSARQAGEQAAKAAAALDQELAQVRGKIAEQEQLKTAAMKERDEARTRLDEMRRSTESLSSQSAQKQDSLAKELQSLRDAESAARAKVATAEGKIAQQDSRIQSLERDLAQAKSTLSARQVDVDRLGKDIAALQQTVREREVAVTRATDEGRVASAKFGREVEQLQGKLAGYETRDKQAAQEREANLRHRSESDRDRQQLDEKIRLAQGKAKDLQAEIDSTKLVATAAASERDKLRREVERLQGDQSQVAKKLEERDSQLTARLTETSRQLAELKQVAARLESERDRARAELERLVAERKRTAESKAREGTSVWAKRLADSAADLEETKVRASGLERKLGETSSRETEFSQRLAKAEETARTAQARVSALERGKTAGTVAVGDASTRIAEMKDAVLAARALVVQSKAWQEQAAAKIAALSEQVRKLGGTPKV